MKALGYSIQQKVGIGDIFFLVCGVSAQEI